MLGYKSIVKLLYNDKKIVAVVDRWSLFRSNLCNKDSKWDLKMVVFRQI